jgi:Amt family ammonium transporter
VYASLAIDTFADDPVGAIAVHGVCGAWGTLAAGLFNTGDMFNMSIVGVQLIGIAAAFLWTFPVSYLVFKVADALVGLRLDDEIERRGLDIHEHDAEAYPEFVTNGEAAQYSPVSAGSS